MRIINHGVAAEVEEGIVEIGESFLKVAEEEIGNALLKVGDGEILVETNSALVAFDLFGAQLSVLNRNYCRYLEP